jgi:proteasome lid subunit RPN8/RPN11
LVEGIKITEAVWQRVWTESTGSPDAEVCGAIIGGTEFVSMVNRSKNAALAYVYDTTDQKYVWGQWDRSEPLILFHSHPVGKAYPSVLDIEYARNKGVLYLIFSVREMAARMFRIQDGQVEDVIFTVRKDDDIRGHHPEIIVAPSKRDGTRRCICGVVIPEMSTPTAQEWWTNHILEMRGVNQNLS